MAEFFADLLEGKTEFSNEFFEVNESLQTQSQALPFDLKSISKMRVLLGKVTIADYRKYSLSSDPSQQVWMDQSLDGKTNLIFLSCGLQGWSEEHVLATSLLINEKSQLQLRSQSGLVLDLGLRQTLANSPFWIGRLPEDWQSARNGYLYPFFYRGREKWTLWLDDQKLASTNAEGDMQALKSLSKTVTLWTSIGLSELAPMKLVQGQNLAIETHLRDGRRIVWDRGKLVRKELKIPLFGAGSIIKK